VLSGINATIEAGELVGLIGPNGAGKTSLLRVLAHLLAPSSGVVRCDGRPLGDYSPVERAQRIAYLAQGGEVHWPMTVEKLVALGRLPHRGSWERPPEADRDAIEAAIQATDVGEFRERTLATLSSGERMRVLFARVLAVGSPILLADEPIAALDPFHQLRMIEVLREAAHGGRAVVAVLHDLTLAARFCDRLLLLHDGAILADGPPGVVLDERHLEPPTRSPSFAAAGRSRSSSSPGTADDRAISRRYPAALPSRQRSELELRIVRRDRRVRPRSG
jgi:iron complex transport system ATP-binding protein